MASLDCIMDTHSSDSSIGEPTAVRRRVDLAGNFAATREGGASACQLSPGAREASDKLVSAEVETRGSEKVNGVLADIADTSSSDGGFSIRDADQAWRSVDGQRRNNSVPRDKSREIGDERLLKTVSNESCESSNTSERNDSQGKDNSSGDGNVSLQYSNSISESASEGDSCLSYFEGTSFSMAALDASYEKAKEALELEEEREEEILTIISRHLSKVSLLKCELHDFQAPIDKLVTDILKTGMQMHPWCGVAKSSGLSMEQRFEAIRNYVLEVFTVSLRQAQAAQFKELIARVFSEKLAVATVGEDGSRKYDEVGDEHTLLGEVANSVRKSRNVVSRQLEVMEKLCAVADKVVAKTEVCCRVIFNCLKTLVSVLEPVVGMNWFMAQMERKLEIEGKGMAKFSDAVCATRQWGLEALSDAEVAVLLHMEANRALHAARGYLEIMMGYQSHGADTLGRVTLAGARLLEMAQQPTARLDEVRQCEAVVKLIRGNLSPLLEDMRKHRTLIEQGCDICVRRVPDTLQALSTVTQGTCNAIEASLRGLSLLPYDFRET